MDSWGKRINYIARQKGWVKANNLQAGDLVLIKKVHPSMEKGWDNTWVNPMNKYVGKVVKVINPNLNDGVLLELSEHELELYFPYTVLQKIQVKGLLDHYEVGDLVYHKDIRKLFEIQRITPGFEHAFVQIYRSNTTSIITTFRMIRHAVKEEIIQYYNEKQGQL